MSTIYVEIAPSALKEVKRLASDAASGRLDLSTMRGKIKTVLEGPNAFIAR